MGTILRVMGTLGAHICPYGHELYTLWGEHGHPFAVWGAHAGRRAHTGQYGHRMGASGRSMGAPYSTEHQPPEPFQGCYDMTQAIHQLPRHHDLPGDCCHSLAWQLMALEPGWKLACHGNLHKLHANWPQVHCPSSPLLLQQAQSRPQLPSAEALFSWRLLCDSAK